MVTGQAIYSFDIGDGLKEHFDKDTAIKEMVAAGKIEITFNEKWYVGVNASDMFYFAADDHVEIESHEALEALYRSCVADPKRGQVAWASKVRNMQPCRRCYIDRVHRWTPRVDRCSGIRLLERGRRGDRRTILALQRKQHGAAAGRRTP